MKPQRGFPTRDFTFSRSLAENTLAVSIENEWSVKNPLQCLDLSVNNEEGKKWLSKYESSVLLVGVKPTKNDSNGYCDSTTKNVEFESEDNNYAIVEKTDFNFIYVECTTEGSTYFDCVFRKIARNGVFVLTTSDDPALYGRPAEPALRCYSGLIARTFYAPEMAVRLILAAMTRSAARFSKSIEVLLAVVIKNSVTIIVKVKKGADSAVKCLKEIRTLVHCSVCEERSFLPNNDGFIIDDVKSYLSCCCTETSVGRTIMSLGPLWAGPIGSESFVAALLPHVKNSLRTTSFLQDLVTEIRCPDNIQSTKQRSPCEGTSESSTSISKESPSTPAEVENDVTDENNRKRKNVFVDSKLECKMRRGNGSEPAPPFYYNIHKHKPKSAQKLMKIDKLICLLHGLGFRASRTHFDRAAVKTNCTLKELQSIMNQNT